jgi:hypothetical protein
MRHAAVGDVPQADADVGGFQAVAGPVDVATIVYAVLADRIDINPVGHALVAERLQIEGIGRNSFQVAGDEFGEGFGPAARVATEPFGGDMSLL